MENLRINQAKTALVKSVIMHVRAAAARVFVTADGARPPSTAGRLLRDRHELPE